MKLEKYSIGIGDRFAHEGKAQLKAIMKANQFGLNISPVWNKSNREHMIVGSHPSDVRKEAEDAVKAIGFCGKYFVDADHITLKTVPPFVETADFFTIDVASYIGKRTEPHNVDEFVFSCKEYLGQLTVPGIVHPFEITKELLTAIANNFLAAAKQASKIYDFIKYRKGQQSFITEVSMDEVPEPQNPIELFFILKMLADHGVPVQTIAPKFTGRFNKGVDYQGDLQKFSKEFEEEILILNFAIKEFGLPDDLKLSIHTGSDKFSIYPIMGQIIRKYDKGLHLKTAGTTWLEEVIGLASAGNQALETVKHIYVEGLKHHKELAAPYTDVIDIDASKLPSEQEVLGWTSEKFVNTLQHIPENKDYNPDFRQLIHLSYKIAAEMGEDFTSLLEIYSDIIENCVENNIFQRHISSLFFENSKMPVHEHHPEFSTRNK
jgi:tagaturonate epimerase